MRIADNVVLGLDLGSSSIGWALIEESPITLEKHILHKVSPDGIVTYAIGSRIIDAPEDAKTHELLNVARRQKRSVRRVIARKAQRMKAVRNLIAEAGVPEVKDLDAVYHEKGTPQRSPWELRSRGLQHPLSDLEFAVALIHIAKHRGFRSNSKNENNDDAGKVKESLRELGRKLEESGAETIGQLMAERPDRRNRKNYKGEAQYTHMVMRSWQEKEVHLLFERQRTFGNRLAASGIEERFCSLAFDQRELKSVAFMVGNCVFLEHEKRAPAFSPTAELFRFLQRIVHIRVRQDDEVRPLSLAEQQSVAELFGHTAKITYKSVRKKLKFDSKVFFDDLSYPMSNGVIDMKEENADIVRRSGASCAGVMALKSCLGSDLFERLWQECSGEKDRYPGWPVIDRIAKILSDNDGFGGMEHDLAELDIDDSIKKAIMSCAREGKFSAFRGTMNLSVKAMRAVIPFMRMGMRYDEACDAAGFDHTKEREVEINNIRNPVVQHLLREVKRQVRAVCHEFGLWPGRVNIEMLRDVGKSASERKKMDAGIRARTSERERNRKALEEKWNRPPSSAELKRYELWLEQNEHCAYVQLIGADSPVYRGAPGGHIPLDWLKDGMNHVQIDHILPRSRTFDNSRNNQCLCLAGANQSKLNKTPFEWRGSADAEAWHRYSVWINTLHIKPRKKRVFLLKDLSGEVEGRFHARNVTDSAYTARLVAQWFRNEYAYLLKDAPDEEKNCRRVYTRPGAVTNFLRHVWGVQSLKKNEEGEREGDQHHALDAVIVACCTEGMLQAVTRQFKKNELDGLNERLPRPWEHFRESLEPLINSVSVSREIKHKKSGALHEETLRSLREESVNGVTRQMVYERRWVNNLSMRDLENIKDPERCRNLVAALRVWLALPEKSRPPFIDPDSGNVVRHVRVRRGEFSSGITLKRGSGVAQADNGEMARTDVYSRDGKFYLVPVYMKDIADGRLPLRASKNATPEAQWPVMDESYEFLFSLTKNCYVLTAKQGVIREGYFVGMDRASAAISLSLAEDKQKLIRGIGVLRLDRFEKYVVDRLGRRIRATRERDPRRS